MLLVGAALAAGGVLDAAGMVVTSSGRHFDRGAGEPDDGRYSRPAWVFITPHDHHLNNWAGLIAATAWMFTSLPTGFLPEEDQPNTPALPQTDTNGFEADDESPSEAARAALEAKERNTYRLQADAPPCHECGEIMVRNGACYACVNCGATSGCS